MAGRKTILANGEIYHIFNRGVEHRQTFQDIRDYRRAIEAIEFYLYNPKIKFSEFKNLPEIARNEMRKNIFKLPKIVEIICYCLMPNHFHFILKQLTDNGIANFISKFTNSYTKYFNTKNKRDGALFGGTFKAARIGNDEQLLHVSRYVHINPIISFLVKPENLKDYSWSSFGEYMGSPGFCTKELILEQFKSSEDYNKFLLDQVDYAHSLANINHQLLDGEV